MSREKLGLLGSAFLRMSVRGATTKALRPAAEQLVISPPGGAAPANSARSWLYMLAGGGIVASGIVLHNQPPTIPRRIASGSMVREFEELKFAGRAGAATAGHGDTAKFEDHNGEFAYVKSLSNSKLAREVVVGRVLAEITKKVFGKDMAPLPGVIVNSQTKLAKAANYFSDLLSSLAIVDSAKNPYTSTMLWSPSLGADSENLGVFLSRVKGEGDIKGLKVSGLGCAIALRNIFAGDSNHGNYIFVYGKDGEITAASIDHEIPSGLPRFIGLGLAPNDAALKALRVGFVTEATDSKAVEEEMSALERITERTRQQQLSDAVNDSEIAGVSGYTDEQIAALAGLMEADIKDGKVLAAYKAVASLTRSDVEALVHDVSGLLDPSLLEKEINQIMVCVKLTKRYIDCLPAQEQGDQEGAYVAPQLK